MTRIGFGARLTLALLLGAGCGALSLVNGTNGDRGRSAWNLEDGLCGGFGTCDLDVPVAVGVTIEVEARVLEGMSDGLQIAASGPLAVGETRVDSEEQVSAELELTGPGVVELQLLDAEGGEFDRTRFTVATPAGLRCGALPPGEPARYDGTGVAFAEPIVLTLPVDDEENVDQPDLLCVVSDAGDVPLLSVGLVQWEVVDASAAVLIRSEPFQTPSASASGARVYLEPMAAGEAQIRATLGELSETLTVVVQ